MNPETITILCSGVALGVYTPALIINQQLREFGYITDFQVIEGLLPEKRRNQLEQAKLAFHRKMAVAVMGHKMARDITPSLDEAAVSSLLGRWREARRRRFLVFSGFWMPLVDRYVSENPGLDASVDLCFMDSVLSPAWKLFQVQRPCFRPVWFLRHERKRVEYWIRVSRDDSIPYPDRSDRFLIHGGGWGMGDYQTKIPLLEELGFALDVIAYEDKDFASMKSPNRYFMLDPKWKAWETDGNECHGFPPLGEVMSKGEIIYRQNRLFHEGYHLVRQCRALVSKPGGGTLLDCFSAGTPLLMLDPIGDHERQNAELWQHLGFGMLFQDWLGSGSSNEVLEKLHQNILHARLHTRTYLETHYAPKDQGNV